MKNCGVLVPRKVRTWTQLSAAAGRTALSGSTPKPTNVTKVLQVGGKPRSSREGQGPRTIGRELGGGAGGGRGHAPVAEEDTKSLAGSHR